MKIIEIKGIAKQCGDTKALDHINITIALYSDFVFLGWMVNLVYYSNHTMKILVSISPVIVFALFQYIQQKIKAIMGIEIVTSVRIKQGIVDDHISAFQPVHLFTLPDFNIIDELQQHFSVKLFYGNILLDALPTLKGSNRTPASAFSCCFFAPCKLQ